MMMMHTVVVIFSAGLRGRGVLRGTLDFSTPLGRHHENSHQKMTELAIQCPTRIAIGYDGMVTRG